MTEVYVALAMEVGVDVKLVWRFRLRYRMERVWNQSGG